MSFNFFDGTKKFFTILAGFWFFLVGIPTERCTLGRSGGNRSFCETGPLGRSVGWLLREAVVKRGSTVLFIELDE